MKMHAPAIRTVPLRPPDESERLLQPLREIGTIEKTQPWSIDEIQQARREAHRRGIAPERLYGTAGC